MDRDMDSSDHLFRDGSFPSGAFLMTGSGIVPGDDVTLEAGDEIEISIDPVGTLTNHVATAR
jgi:2-dehydro-3-deoxy-D-arabinonate dehydratase